MCVCVCVCVYTLFSHVTHFIILSVTMCKWKKKKKYITTTTSLRYVILEMQ